MPGIMTARMDGTKVRMEDLPADAWKIISGGGAGDFADLKELFERVPWLRQGVMVRSAALSAVPWVILRGDEEIDGSEDYQNVTGMWDDPSADMGRAEAALTLFGAAYFLNLKRRGLRYLVPSTIRPKVDADKGLVGFTRSLDGRNPQDFKINEIIHVFGLDPYSEIGAPGSSPALAAMAASGVLKNLDTFMADYFEKGMIDLTLLLVKGSKTQAEMDRIGSMWGRLMKGLKSAFSRAVVNADELTPVKVGEGLSALNGVPVTVEKREDIATALGVPQSLLFSNAANFATATQDNINFYNQTILPDTGLIASALNRQYFKATPYRLQYRPWEMDMFQEDEEDRTGAILNLVSAAEAGSPAVVRLAYEIMGVGLPGGMEYDEFQRLLEEAQASKPAPVAGTAPKLRPASMTDEERQEAAQENDEDVKAMYADLGRWEKKALKRLANNGNAKCKFDSDYIPSDIAALIEDMLEETETEYEIREIFRGGNSGSANTPTRQRDHSVINIHMPEMKVPVSINMPPQEIMAPNVTVIVPEQPPPQVTVNLPETKAAEIVVNVPAQAAPVVNIENNVEFPKRASEKITLMRDGNGRATGAQSETVFEDK